MSDFSIGHYKNDYFIHSPKLISRIPITPPSLIASLRSDFHNLPSAKYFTILLIGNLEVSE
jgi:hypothetical protein